MDLSERLREYRAGLTGDFIAAVEATRFVEMMERDYPEDFAEWVRTHAVKFVTAELGYQERSDRHDIMRSKTLRAFAEAAKDPERLCLYRQTFVIDKANTRRPLGKMTRKDLRFVASRYHASSLYHKSMGTFFDMLAEKVNKAVLDESLPEAEAVRLLRIVMPPPELDRAA